MPSRSRDGESPTKLAPVSGEFVLRLIGALPIPLLVVTDGGEIVSWSDSLLGVLACEANELRGKSLLECCPELTSHAWTTCIRRGESFLLPWGFGCARLFVANVLSAELDGIVFLALTVPNSASYGGATSRQVSLAALGTMVGSVAHDLNNILTSVLGHVSFLRLALAELPVDRSSLGSIEQGTRRAATIAQRILEFTRGAQNDTPGIEVRGAVEGALNLIRTSIPPGIVLSFHPPESRLLIQADESELSQIVINIVLNARDALPRGGTIDVGVQSIVFASPQSIRDRALPAGTYAMLLIRDTGHGIPADLLPKIFETFFTTKAERGTGLGLSIVTSLVDALGGAVDVRSDVAQGTEFRIYVPAVHLEEGISDTPPSDPAEAPGGHERILVVDDEDAVRMIVQRSLEHLGYEVTVASSGAEALEYYRVRPEEYHLVVIDMIMPHMSGDELFRKLREMNPDAPVLVASGYSSDARTRSILDNGGLGFIQKPFAVEELAREVRRCLDLRVVTPL